MKFIGYNIVPIMLLLLAGFLIWKDNPQWQWWILIVIAVFTSVQPETTNTEYMNTLNDVKQKIEKINESTSALQKDLREKIEKVESKIK